MRIRQTTAHPPASPGPSPSPAQPQTPTAHPQILPYNLDNAPSALPEPHPRPSVYPNDASYPHHASGFGASPDIPGLQSCFFY